MMIDWGHPPARLVDVAHRVEDKHRGGALSDRHTQREKKFMRRRAICEDMKRAYREDEEGFINRAVLITALSCPLPKLCAIASRTDRPLHTGRRCEKTDPL
ncbi:hypothetical protein [Burkholderia sp. D-99]|uniref:hypothetical protein n=1 Tax=unclassified Burkholderia TaxID=2613784 RepID=UPI001422530D|nr:hypothetical protein [Burkholderia sp. D-99]MBZ5794494.1 hypothetical protein [Burkholderia contaminans]NHV28294.1 hypothetical protein [Burkholderia sp. D-99]